MAIAPNQPSYNPGEATLYRAGNLQCADAPDHALLADSVMPDEPGRVGRSSCLFCSPGVIGLARWRRANLSHRLPADAHELRLVDGSPEPWVYPVIAWEAVSTSNIILAGRADMMMPYWESGIPLSQYLADPDRLPADEVEILIDPAWIRSKRTVSDKRIITALSRSHDRQQYDIILRQHTDIKIPKAMLKVEEEL